MRPVSDRLHGEEGGKTFLPEAELTLDLALRLRIFGNQMADAEATEGALELGEGLGVEVVGKAVGEKNFPDMGKWAKVVSASMKPAPTMKRVASSMVRARIWGFSPGHHWCGELSCWRRSS